MYRQSVLEGIVNFFVGLAELILGLRVVFLFLSANPNLAFVNWIYKTSDTLISPFRGIFTPQAIGHGHILDITALFAMLMYALFGFLLGALLRALSGGDHSKKSS